MQPDTLIFTVLLQYSCIIERLKG